MNRLQIPLNILVTMLAMIGIYSCSDKMSESKENGARPNVLLIMTDDQGIGDFGFMGNPYIKTPNLDEP